MCIHGIEEKCVKKSERARVKYSYKPKKKKKKTRDGLQRKRLWRGQVPHFSLSRKFFSFFCVCEGETKAKAKGDDEIKKKKKFHHQKARVHVYPPLCHYPPPS